MATTSKSNNNKAVNFDLDTNVIKLLIAKKVVSFKTYTVAYGRIRKFLSKNGFEHDQGSGYVSRGSMPVYHARKIFTELGKKNP